MYAGSSEIAQRVESLAGDVGHTPDVHPVWRATSSNYLPARRSTTGANATAASSPMVKYETP